MRTLASGNRRATRTVASGRKRTRCRRGSGETERRGLGRRQWPIGTVQTSIPIRKRSDSLRGTSPATRMEGWMATRMGWRVKASNKRLARSYPNVAVRLECVVSLLGGIAVFLIKPSSVNVANPLGSNPRWYSHCRG